jgi:hypothetical protein
VIETHAPGDVTIVMHRRAIMVPRLVHCTLLAMCVSLPVAAQPAATKLDYAAYSNGVNVLDLQASMALSPSFYRVQVSYHLTGLVGAIVHADSQTTVDGRFQGDRTEPRELFSSGHMRGQPRVTQIDWQNGNPVIMQMVPPVETERDPVPAEDQAHTIDSLSAMAALLRRVAATGRCEGAANTFDGRRLSEIEAHTVGEETLEKSDRSIFQGTALRCDFQGRQLAGFFRDHDPDVVRRPQHGSAWFARLAPGDAPVPVRITFETRVFGWATLYLTGQS